MKEYDFGQTLAFITQGKGDLRGIFNAQLDQLRPPRRAFKKIIKPAELAKKLRKSQRLVFILLFQTKILQDS